MKDKHLGLLSSVIRSFEVSSSYYFLDIFLLNTLHIRARGGIGALKVIGRLRVRLSSSSEARCDASFKILIQRNRNMKGLKVNTHESSTDQSVISRFPMNVSIYFTLSMSLSDESLSRVMKIEI